MFDTSAWFENLQQYGLSELPVRVHVMELFRADDESVIGWLHLMQSEVGGPLQGLSNHYSSLFGPVWSEGRGKEVDWRELVARIKRLPGASVVRLQPLAADGGFIQGMEGGLRACGYCVDRFFCFGNWYHPVAAGGFDRYWLQRPASLRNTVERARRRLNRSHVWRIDVLSESSPALEEGIAAYQRVYAHSWKAPEPNAAFMPALIRMLARQGTLRLGMLWLDGEVVAAQVWIVQDRKANIFKLAYRTGCESLSVGSILTAALMQHVIDVDLVQEVDYLTGDDLYKKDWMSHRRERVGLIAFDRRRLRGCLAWVRHSAGKVYRRYMPKKTDARVSVPESTQ